MLKFNLLHTFPAFTIKNYRTFFLSQWVALMGLWMQLTAQQWLVYEITDSPLLLGVLSTMQYMPSLLFTLWTGFWIDRHKKKSILLGTQLMYMLQAFLFGLILFTVRELHRLRFVLHLYVVVEHLQFTVALLLIIGELVRDFLGGCSG